MSQFVCVVVIVVVILTLKYDSKYKTFPTVPLPVFVGLYYFVWLKSSRLWFFICSFHFVVPHHWYTFNDFKVQVIKMMTNDCFIQQNVCAFYLVKFYLVVGVLVLLFFV